MSKVDELHCQLEKHLHEIGESLGRVDGVLDELIAAKAVEDRIAGQDPSLVKLWGQKHQIRRAQSMIMSAQAKAMEQPPKEKTDVKGG